MISIDPSAGSGDGTPVRRRLRRRLWRTALAALLVLVPSLAVALMLALTVLRRELKVRADRDMRPCPACRSPALFAGHALLDEQGHRLLFATPEQAAAYAAAYAKP